MNATTKTAILYVALGFLSGYISAPLVNNARKAAIQATR